MIMSSGIDHQKNVTRLNYMCAIFIQNTQYEIETVYV